MREILRLIRNDEEPETHKDTKRLFDIKFKEEASQNLHTYLPRVISVEPYKCLRKVNQLRRDMLKLNKDRMKALGPG